MIEDIGRGLTDEELIPEIAQTHGILVTKDGDFYGIRAQRELCEAKKIGPFVPSAI